MARGGGIDLTSIVVLGAAGYAAYKAGLLCNMWPGAPCPSGGPGGGGGCQPACVPPQTCVNGVCQNPSPLWQFSYLTIDIPNSGAVVPGESIDGLLTFFYTGPGGVVNYGFFTGYSNCPGALGICCPRTFANSMTLAPASTPTQVQVSTSGQIWDGTCCPSVAGFDVVPFVQPLTLTVPYIGPTYGQLLRCG